MNPAILLPAASYEFATIQKVSGSGPPVPASDQLAAEEPLEIRVGYETDGQRQHRTLSVTMRTPGHDEELAAGFLLTEGIIHAKADLLGVIPCPDVQKAEEAGNVVRAELAAHVKVDFAAMERHFYTSSSCGVCGKTSIDAVRTASCPVLPAAGIGVLAAVGAPSSLAIQAAESFGMTVLGFVRNERFNIYSHGWRLRSAPTAG